jgi:hypothetical protein
VLANPATSVSAVNARTRSGPYQRVNAANAGGYSTPAIATPTTAQPTRKKPRFGAHATPATAGIARIEPAAITGRGPTRSNHRPTGMPVTAATNCARDSPAVTHGSDQPVESLMSGASTGKA